jgi:hypothetical protein
VEFAGAEKVWKVVDGESREQQVLAGERRQDQVQILQGLREGDFILREGMSGMSARVIPVNRSDAIPGDVSDTIQSPESEGASVTADQKKQFPQDSQSAALKSAAAE